MDHADQIGLAPVGVRVSGVAGPEAENRLRVGCHRGRLASVIELRELTAEDWPLWRELRLAALAQSPYAFGSRLADWQGEGDREQRWREWLELPGSTNLVALMDGTPVGMASGVPGGVSGTAELISMWVSPQARGHGVGERLVAAVEQWARQRGADQLRLEVAVGNETATRLYHRGGFRPTGEVCRPARPEGGRPTHVMAKPLGPTSH